MNLKIYLLFILVVLANGLQAQIAPRFVDTDSLVVPGAVDVEGQWVDLNADGQFDFLSVVEDSLGITHPLFITVDSFELKLDTLKINDFEHHKIKIADLDNNNRQDIIALTAGDAIILSVFYQIDSLEFERVDLDSSMIDDVEILDLNRDGFRDAVFYGMEQDSSFLKMKLNKGAREWEATTEIDSLSHGKISLLKALDYDNNGEQDLLISSDSATFTRTEIWLNTDAEFSLSSDSLPVLRNANASFGDFNGDGRFDITLSGKDSLDVSRSILYINGFGAQSLEELDSMELSSTFMADLSSDGRLDVAFSTVDPDSSLFIMLNSGAGFTNEPFESGNGVSGWQRYADVDCDGDLDVMTVLVGDTTLFRLRENITTGENFGPLPPSRHVAFPLDGEVAIVWERSADDLTSSFSLSYDIYLGTADLTKGILAPDFTLGSSRRSLVSFGNSGLNTELKVKLSDFVEYEYGIQSIDNAFYTAGCKGDGGPGGICPLGAVACGAFILCEEIAYENITTCPGNVLTLTAPNPDAAWYSTRRGFLGFSESINYRALALDTVYQSFQGANSCDEIVAYIIDVQDLSLQDVFGCEGDLIELGIPSTFDSVRWELKSSGEIFEDLEIQIELLDNDSIYVTAFLGDCMIMDTVALTLSKPELMLTVEQVKIFAGEDVQLGASGGESYNWTPTAGLNNGTIPNPVASPSETTRYQVTLTDSVGCSVMGEVLVIVEHQAFIPNLFTPNGDGQNDALLVYGVEEANSFELKIFNRSGNLVFSTDDVTLMSSTGWDGLVNGREQASGVYYWEVQGEFIDGKTITLNGRSKGAVYLVK